MREAAPSRAATGGAAAWSVRDQAILLAIFAGALGLRLLHFAELRTNDPFFTIPAVDGQVYDAQARAIAGGDWAGEGVLFLGPLYPFFMGLVYALAGPSPPVLKQLQAALGAVDCLLVAALAGLCFDRATALVAAGLTAVYGMLVFYGGTVMIVNAMVPLVLGSLLLTVRALREPTVLRWGVAGLVVGAAVLARQTLLLYAAATVVWLVYALRGRLPFAARARRAAAFALGVALLVLPFSVRNYAVGGDLVLLNSTGGMNLYMGNNPRATGAWTPPAFPMRADSPHAMRDAFRAVAEAETGRPMKPSEISAHWQAKAVDWVLENPGDWLRLELRKLVLFWNAREVWNNRSVEISRSFSWVLRLPLLTFGVLAPLALLGMGLAWRRWRELFPLYALVGASLATALAAFVLSRYRMTAVPVLLVFGAYAVTELVRRVRGRAWAKAALATAWLVPLTALVHLDMGRENLFMAWYNLGNKYRDLGRYDEAIESYGRSLAINPGFVSTHNNLALAYEGAGRRQDAIETWRVVERWAEERGSAARLERARSRLEALLAEDGAFGMGAVDVEVDVVEEEVEEEREGRGEGAALPPD